MSTIDFTSKEKEAMVEKLQAYFEKELDQDLGQFDAEFLLDFVSKELGAYFYNRGLHDARAVLENKLSTIDEDLYAIEIETN
ncbi:MAG: DUF2164 domain-containing protein [Pseudomonadota bacterium]|nr:DUF2164 domain-containing protein [Pseudomonadota bacterium]